MRWVPNLLTCVRIALTPFIVYLVLARDCGTALPVTLVAGLTDAADGYLARRFQAEGRLGAWLDPIADKLLLTSLYISFALAGLAPAWLVWLVVGRDVLILLMAALGLIVAAIRDFPPTIWGKVSTIIQIGATPVFLLACTGCGISTALAPAAVGLVAVATAWSGLHYMYRASVMFREWRSAGPHKV